VVRGRRITWVLVGALAFGLVAAWAKDPGSNGRDDIAQLRSALGNLSVPWVLLAFAAGATARGRLAGAFLGLAATTAALAAFYVFSTLAVDVGGHGLVADLRIELVANRYYFAGGLVTGPIFGAVGAWWRRSRSLRVSIVTGGLLMGEPIALAMLGGVDVPRAIPLLSGWGFPSSGDTIAFSVYVAEFAAGALLVARSLAARR
jgi:Family of unknown function (DUF6518)